MKIFTKTILGIVIILLTLLLWSVFTSEKITLTPNTEIKIINVFIDEKSNDSSNHERIKFATIEVKPLTGDLTLKTIVNDTLNIKKLENVLTDINNRTALKLTVENYETINGSRALVMKEVGVLKTDINYIYAVRETLEKEFGFESEIEK